MEDYLVKSVAENDQFRAYAVNATALVEEAHQIHDTWSASSAALGLAMVGTLLLATSGLQGEAGMTVKIQGDGPVGFIVVDGTAQGTVKAYMQNPHVHLPLNAKGKIDVAECHIINSFTALTAIMNTYFPSTGTMKNHILNLLWIIPEGCIQIKMISLRQSHKNSVSKTGRICRRLPSHHRNRSLGNAQ